jgi:hypothetical protein
MGPIVVCGALYYTLRLVDHPVPFLALGLIAHHFANHAQPKSST